MFESIDQVIGYLNFSSGHSDPRFLCGIDDLFRIAEAGHSVFPGPDAPSVSGSTPDRPDESAELKVEFSESVSVAGRVLSFLNSRIELLRSTSDTWRDVLQSQLVLALCSDYVLPAYLRVHRDQLFHQDQQFLFNSFFVGRVLETTLVEAQPWSETLPWVSGETANGLMENLGSEQQESVKRLVGRIVAKLNDHIGHRPVASLESQNIQPYPGEWVCPVPVFVIGAGTATGPYEEIICGAMEILRSTSPHVLRAASFDPARLAELSIDPRAFDFDHPVNKRPNHHFGSWDEQRISQDGYYERFLIHQVVLDSLIERVERDSAVSTSTGQSKPIKKNKSSQPGGASNQNEATGQTGKSDQTGTSEQGGTKNLNAGTSEATAVDPPAVSRDQLMFEASAVLAGTMLMASGITSERPLAYDSNVTLSSLLPVIGGYRDDFYDDLISKMEGEHRARLTKETRVRHQPFGSVRQDLNAQLARRRANQLVNCRLASIFARMGYPDAAEEQSKIVPVASARILCQLDCLLSSGNQLLDRLNQIQLGRVSNLLQDSPAESVATPDPPVNEDTKTAEFAGNSGEATGNDDLLLDASKKLPRIFARLKQGINCGAIIDPWNILGFDAQYSLFPALENSVSDHRAHDLVEVIERILGFCSRLWSEAAALDREDVCVRVKQDFRDIADWWRKFAAHEVMSVDAVDPEEVFGAAELVAKALQLWHQGGAATGDIRFWSAHAGLFDSPKAYALVIDALMQRADFQTSSALLIHWLSEADFVGLQMGDSSFHELVFRWINEQKSLLTLSLYSEGRDSSDEGTDETNSLVIDRTWNRIRKFYDFVEANANEYWNVPSFAPGDESTGSTINPIKEIDDTLDNLAGPGKEDGGLDDGSNDPMINDVFEPGIDGDDSSSDLFGAAYEGMSYSDTTDDGIEGAVYDDSLTTDDSLEAEVDRILERLEFLATLSGYWQVAATIPLPESGKENPCEKICERLVLRREIVSAWVAQAVRNRDRMIQLLDAVNRYRIPRNGIDRDSMIEYDRHRLYKEALLDRVINTCVETENAVRMLMAVVRAVDHVVDKRPLNQPNEDSIGGSLVGGHNELVTVFAADLLDRADSVAQYLPALIEFLKAQPLLYLPVSRGGNPAAIVRARVIQTALLDLLGSLPSLGLLVETHELTRTALAMERANPVSSGAVTGFDQLFQVAFSSMVQSLIESSAAYSDQMKLTGEMPVDEIKSHSETILFECIEMLTQSMLDLWLDHSRTLRLSVLEKTIEPGVWKQLKDFIGKYGTDLFTQQFFQLANVRAILHQGAANWLERLQKSPSCPDWRLLDELGSGIEKKRAAASITLVLDSILENYSEYCDYNSTTTQSDSGNLVYVLLDFLRLRSSYESVCWKLKPVVWAHEILVRDGENGVARMWRRSLRDRIGPEADKYLSRLEILRSKYSIRMESVGRRLEERFEHPMQIDRLRALVGPAMQDPQDNTSRRTFELLFNETRAFTRTTMGVGMDVPGWLAALESEVQQNLLFNGLQAQFLESPEHDFEPAPIAELRKQLEALPLPGRVDTKSKPDGDSKPDSPESE